MIIDKISNWQSYPFSIAWQLAFDFLKLITPDCLEKKYEILGDQIFASVTSYNTRAPEAALIEAHREFVDVQAVIRGSEIIECSSSDGLLIDTVYDESKDVEFFRRLCPGFTRVELSPGWFIVLFPGEAHMPSLMRNETSEMVKKVVVKIKADFLGLKYFNNN